MKEAEPAVYHEHSYCVTALLLGLLKDACLHTIVCSYSGFPRAAGTQRPCEKCKVVKSPG